MDSSGLEQDKLTSDAIRVEFPGWWFASEGKLVPTARRAEQNGRGICNCCVLYEGHLESKERFAIQRYLLIIGKKKNMQVLSHTFTYFST